jgi:PQQ-like domain
LKQDLELNLNEITLWKTRLPEVDSAILPGRDCRNNPVSSPSRLFFSVFSPGAVCALDLETGRLLWRQQLSGLGGSSPYMAGSYLFAKTSREILSLDPDTGEVRWSFQPYSESGEWLYASPTFHEGLIYFGDRNGFLHCLEAASGKQVWCALTNEDNHDCNATPIVAEGRVITATNASSVLAYEPLSGREIWRQKLDGPCSGPLLQSSNQIAAATHTLSFLDPLTGQRNGQYSKRGHTSWALACSGDRVISCSKDVDALFSNAASAGVAEIAVLQNGQLVASDQIEGWVITLNTLRCSTLVSCADLEKVTFFDPAEIRSVATLQFPVDSKGVCNPEMRDATGYILCGDGTVYSLNLVALDEYRTDSTD